MQKLAIILGLFCLYACSNNADLDPEQEIRNTLSSIEKGIENRSLSQVIDHISDDYKDHQGQLKQDIKRLTQFQILKNKNIHLFTRIKSIEIDHPFASVELSTAMASQSIDLSVAENRLKADTYKASIVLKNEGNNWYIVSSSWQRGW